MMSGTQKIPSAKLKRQLSYGDDVSYSFDLFAAIVVLPFYINSIDIKALIIGALLTTVVFMSTGWQACGIQKVEIVQGSINRLKI